MRGYLLAVGNHHRSVTTPPSGRLLLGLWLFIGSSIVPCCLAWSTCTTITTTMTMDSTKRQQHVETKFRLITNKMCPYAQKAWIALEYAIPTKQLELVEISLYGSNGKPDWFWELNSQGTVPVLEVLVKQQDDNSNKKDHQVLPDSDLILNYLQDHPHFGKAFLPASSSSSSAAAATKAEVATWRNRIRKLLPIGKRAVLDRSTQDRDALHQCLQSMDQAVIGPFLTGEQITIADCHAFPFLWRLNDEYDFTKLRCHKLHNWLQQCQQEQAFRKTIQSSWWWWW